MSGTSRYETILKLAAGGMATVWVGNVRGALGFRQLVAIKKPHPQLLGDAAFRAELVAEARLASMIHHANVVDVRDVEVIGDAISLVMDYIEGASLSELLAAAARRETRLPPRVSVRIALDALAGLHAAHELVDERGRHVGLVHRDVSPQNVLVGADGTARVADFGVAKFAHRTFAPTAAGNLKGKLAYMAPEYIRGEPIDRRFDVFAIGVVLWEALAGKRCFRAASDADTISRVLMHDPEPVSGIAPDAAALDAVVARALAKKPEDRFPDAAAMAEALEAAAGPARLVAGAAEVAAAVKDLVGEALERRRAEIRATLANEPTVASLMGADLVAPAPATVKEGAARRADPVTARAPALPPGLAHAATTLPSADHARAAAARGPLVPIKATLSSSSNETAMGRWTVLGAAVMVAALAAAIVLVLSANSERTTTTMPSPQPSAKASSEPLGTAPAVSATPLAPAVVVDAATPSASIPEIPPNPYGD